MKKILLLIAAILMLSPVYSQESFESTIRKFNIGVGMHTDMWFGLPDGVSARTINQGAQINGMYNYRLGEGVAYIAGGIGIGTHNMYTNSYIPDVKADSISFVQIPDGLSYKKSKVSLAYIDIPLEFRIKTRKNFRIAFGFKVGFLINAHQKYKGNRIEYASDGQVITDGPIVKDKWKDIKQIESVRYGPTFRIGYKWINLTAYYQVSKVFKVDKGPQAYPLSLGIAVIPY